MKSQMTEAVRSTPGTGAKVARSGTRWTSGRSVLRSVTLSFPRDPARYITLHILLAKRCARVPSVCRCRVIQPGVDRDGLTLWRRAPAGGAGQGADLAHGHRQGGEVEDAGL